MSAATADFPVLDLREEGNAADQRATARLPYILQVDVHSEHNFYTGFTQNISSGGLFVATSVPEPVGTVLTFDLRLAPGRGVVRVKGMVRWVREANEYVRDVPPGMGIQFLELASSVEKAINGFINDSRESIFYDDED